MRANRFVMPVPELNREILRQPGTDARRRVARFRIVIDMSVIVLYLSIIHVEALVISIRTVDSKR
jgi:hypothetical protein